MQSDVRFPRLLDGNFRERRRLRPISLSLSLERAACSTAELTLPEAEGPLPFLSFLELYTPRGSAGIYRVTADSDATQGVRTYPLRHAIDTLHDSLWKAQTDFSGTMAQFLAALLAQQTTRYWQLGVCQDSGNWKRDGINYDRLDALLDEVREDRRDYMFTYDFSTTPWTLNFVRVSDTVDAEMRLTRNLLEGTVRRTRDGMGNRLHLSISTTAREADGSPGETTVEYRTYNDAASQALYGVVEISANVDSEEVSDPDAWAAQFLREHALPIAQASADGWEIVKSTGEAWDQLDLGKRCRLAAKREGFPAEFPIERIQYENLFGDDPDRVRVDMNRKLPRFSERLAQARETASRAYSAARGNSARIKRNEQVDEHYQHITKENTQGMEDCFGVIGVKLDPVTHQPMKDSAGNYIWVGAGDASAEIWNHFHRTAWQTLIANVVKDGQGNVLSIGQVSTSADGKVFIDAINDQRTGTAKINANRVSIQSTSGSGIEIDTSGNISINAGETVTRINEQTGQNVVSLNGDRVLIGTNKTLSSILGINTAGGYAYFIGQVGFFNASQSASSLVTINDGKVNAPKLQIANEGSLIFGALNNNTLSITNDILAGMVKTFSASANSLTLTPFRGDTVNFTINAIASFGTVEEDDGEITIPYTKLDGTTGTINFNIAATQFYIDGVAAAYANAVNRVSWPTTPRTQSSFSVSVPGDPWNASTETGTTLNRIFALSAGSFDSDYISTVELAMSHNENGQAVTDGVVAKIDVDASGVYSDGELTGRNSVTISNSDIVREIQDLYNATTHNTTIYIEATASNGAQGTQSFTVSGANAYNDGVRDGGGTAVASSELLVRQDDGQGGQIETQLVDGRQTVNLIAGELCEIDLRYNGNYIKWGYVQAPSLSIGTPFINNPQAGYIRPAVTIDGYTYYGETIKLTNQRIADWGGPIT